MSGKELLIGKQDCATDFFFSSFHSFFLEYVSVTQVEDTQAANKRFFDNPSKSHKNHRNLGGIAVVWLC